MQLDPEVYGIVRLDVCPVHDIVLPQPVLGIFIQDGGLVGGVAAYCFVNYICSVHHNRINALEFHAECGETLIAGNQTQVTHIGQTVDNGHVFQIYRRVVLDVEFIGHIFALHTLHIVVGRLAAVTRYGSRVRVRCAGVVLVGVGNGLPGFGGQTNDVIVCVAPDLVVTLFAGNRIFGGERLCHTGIAGIGDDALFFLTVLDGGGELEDDALVRCKRCLAQLVRINNQFRTVDLVGIAGNRRAAFQQTSLVVCLKCGTAVAVMRQRQFLVGHLQAGLIAELVCRRQIVGQRHAVQFQVCHIGGVASAVVQHSLPDQCITGGDVAVFYRLYVIGIVGLSCKGCHCQLGETRGGGGFGEGDVHLILRRDHTVTAAIFALHHCHLGKGVCQCDFFRRAVCQFLCLVGGQLGLVSQLYANAPLICKFFCGNKCKGQRLSNLSCLNATQSCIICSSLYTIWHIFHAVRQRIFYNDRFPSIVII